MRLPAVKSYALTSQPVPAFNLSQARSPSLQPHHHRVRRSLGVDHRNAGEAGAVRLPRRLPAQVGFADRLAVDEPSQRQRAAQRLERERLRRARRRRGRDRRARRRAERRSSAARSQPPRRSSWARRLRKCRSGGGRSALAVTRSTPFGGADRSRRRGPAARKRRTGSAPRPGGRSGRASVRCRAGRPRRRSSSPRSKPIASASRNP